MWVSNKRKNMNFFFTLNVTEERSCIWIRIHKLEVRIPGSGSAPKCHGSPTQVHGNDFTKDYHSKRMFRAAHCLNRSPNPAFLKESEFFVFLFTRQDFVVPLFTMEII
jgi:hypothetical protein